MDRLGAGGLAALAAMVCLWWWSGGSARTASAPSVAVRVAPADPRGLAEANAFAESLRQSLARVHGLRLVGDDGSSRADLLFEGTVDATAERPSILIALEDMRSGSTVWTGRFARSSAPMPEQQRAVAAAVRYAAVWLSDNRSGATAAREPDKPEVMRLVAEGLREWQVANELRQRRDFAGAERLYIASSAKADRAIALDPESAKALMLRFQNDRILNIRDRTKPSSAFQARTRRADEMLTRALAADPDDLAALIAAAQEFEQSMDWRGAGHCFAAPWRSPPVRPMRTHGWPITCH